MTIVASIGALTALFAATIGLVAERHQAGAGLFDGQPARLHVPGAGRRAPSSAGDLPPVHARLLQGAALPRRRLGHPRACTTSRTCGRWAGCAKYMPITHSTFLIGALAITGSSRFAGFFSKDEILGGAFARRDNRPVGWSVWYRAADRVYMFRVYFPRVRRRAADSSSPDHAEPPRRARRLELVRWPAPRRSGGAWPSSTMRRAAMAFALIVSPVGSSPPDCTARSGGSTFLHPAFANSIHFEEFSGVPHQTFILMAVSLLVALGGIGIAWQMYIAKVWSPQALAARFSRLYDLIYNKWYVDEAYDLLIVQPTLGFARFLWSFDAVIIDGIVNGIGTITRWLGQGLRKTQTGGVGLCPGNVAGTAGHPGRVPGQQLRGDSLTCEST